MMTELSPESRVWIYQNTSGIHPDIAKQISLETAQFARQWTAHNQQLNAWGGVVEDRFVVLMVDESQTGASGCSIDSSVHFIQQLEKKYHLELFNRMILTYKDGDALKTVALSDARELFESGDLKPDTLVADTLVQTKKEFDERFMAPLEKTWAATLVS